MPLEDADPRIEIIGGQVRVAHCHCQGLVAQPHLHAANVDAALDESRSAGVSEDMRNDVRVGGEADLVLGLVPYRAEPTPVSFWNWPLPPTERPIAAFARVVKGTVRLRPDFVSQKLALASETSFHIKPSASHVHRRLRREPQRSREAGS